VKTEYNDENNSYKKVQYEIIKNTEQLQYHTCITNNLVLL